MCKEKKILRKIILLFIGIIVIFFGYNMYQYSNVTQEVQEKLQNTTNVQEAYFSGGCFWCTESSFEKYKKNGIIDVISGYAGGTVKNPTYIEVGKGNTGHREAVKVIYDADRVAYNDLLEIFWRTVNPTDNEGQYIDRGFQYTSAIFYSSLDEKKISEQSLDKIQKSGRYGDKKIITPIIAFTNFYNAEDYHQDYYIKNPVRYNVYTNGSGRKEYLKKIWGDKLHYSFGNESINKGMTSYNGKKLTKLQYKVTQNQGTERAFDNEYWDNKKEGIYVDIIDGTALYSSIDKYKSGTGWPSFTKPIKIENVGKKEGKGLFYTRTEIIGTKSKAHIGHVFTDGPVDKGGLRYCMNSAALDFIPKEKLEARGYGEFVSLFQ